MKINNHSQKSFEYLNHKNHYFRGYDTFLYEALTKINGNISFPKIIEAIENINYYSNCNAVFEFYFPIIAHILFYKPELADRILAFSVRPIFALGIIDNEDDFIDLINKNKTPSNNPYFLTEEGIKWVENTLPNQKEEIRKIVEMCKIELE